MDTNTTFEEDYNARRDCYKIGIAIESTSIGDSTSLVHDMKEGVVGAMTIDGLEAIFVEN